MSIAGREAAIVSTQAGTTRDVIELAMDLGGWPVTLADTAGLRALDHSTVSGHAEIEAEGMRRAQRRAAVADLRLVVLAADAGARALADPALRDVIDPTSIVIWNKIDLVPRFTPPESGHGGETIMMSVRDGTGLGPLLATLEQRAAHALARPAGEPVMITRARHREILTSAHAALVRARAVDQVEFIAEELRVAAEAIGRITGRSGVEDKIGRAHV